MIILVSRNILQSNLQFLEYRFNSAGKLVALAKLFATPSFRIEDIEFILIAQLYSGNWSEERQFHFHDHQVFRQYRRENSIVVNKNLRAT